MEDYLVYELVKPTRSRVGFTTDPNDVMSRFPDFVFKPLFGFYGTFDECLSRVNEYIDSIQVYAADEHYLSIYELTCLDPTVTESYVGKTSDSENDRMKAHEIDSLVKKTKVYAFMREHGSCLNWKMTALGWYKTDSTSNHSHRLEWYWWKKKGSKLNSVVPGIGVVTRDRLNMKLTEAQILSAYEVLEERLNVNYTGDDAVPEFFTPRVLYLDCEAPVQKKPYVRYVWNKTVSFHLQEDPYGTVFMWRSTMVEETYLGFAVVRSSMAKWPHLVQLFIAFNDPATWRRHELFMSRKSEYSRLRESHALNHLTHEQLVMCCGKGTPREKSASV
jgi:hypothetical protein